MQAMSPEDICGLFQRAMAEGDLDAALSLYDPEAVIVNQSGEAAQGRQSLRQELAPLAAMKARFDFSIKQIAQAGDIALVHVEWTVAGPQPMRVYAIEISRRQPDGSWRWLIGDPHTVGKELGF